MTRFFDQFFLGLNGITDSFVDTTVSSQILSSEIISKNTPYSALAGDLNRVGTQMRLSEHEAKQLPQSEFDFIQ